MKNLCYVYIICIFEWLIFLQIPSFCQMGFERMPKAVKGLLPRFPEWVVWGSIAIWVGKDVILFPLVRKAYDWDRPQGANAMVDERGIAKERLAPSVYVQIRGELWRAELVEGSPPIEKGERVQVEGVCRLKIVVQLVDEKYQNK
jgi:membrane protein implicated in regulation of membrane protease activity